jgi:hypothetical protein
MRVIITTPQLLGNQSVYDDLANMHATLSASGGEGRGEVVINLGSTTSSSALRAPSPPEEEKDFINEFQ